jgi:LmbE family N-acetylglucosaminyl deacetylase
LVLAAHPDDEAAGCVGTIVKHVEGKDRVCVVYATDGRQSKAIADPDAMARHRRGEAMQASRLMGVERVEWLGLGEGAWSIAALQAPLAALMREFDPGIVYAPSRIDFHPEHRRVAHALALALDEQGEMQLREKRVRVYQVQVPLDILANLVSDIAGVHSRCAAVLAAYVSQVASLQSCARLRRYTGLCHGIRGEAEVFWELPAQRYAALHGYSPDQWPARYRGLRHFPLTDPLAFMAGACERREIKNGEG